MSATIIATVGGSTSNCYVTQVEAQAYFDARPNVSAWTGASTDDKVASLISATNRLEQETWEGVRTDTAQALAWPRVGTYDRDGFCYASTSIPRGIKNGTYELALAILADDLLTDTGLEGFESVKIGPLEVTPRQGRQAGALPRNVRREIAHMLETESTSNVRLSR